MSNVLSDEYSISSFGKKESIFHQWVIMPYGKLRPISFIYSVIEIFFSPWSTRNSTKEGFVLESLVFDEAYDKSTIILESCL